MKKTLVLFTLLLAFGFTLGQTKVKEKDFPVRYSLKISKDTVTAHIKNNIPFKSKAYSPYVWIDEIVFITQSGSKVIVRENDLDYLEIKDHHGVVRKFVSPPNLSKLKLHLVQVNYEGKLSLYTDYYIENSSRNLVINQYLAEDDKEVIQVGFYGRDFDSSPGFKSSGQLNVGFFNGFRLELKERLSMHPDLLELVDKMKTYDDLLNILMRYNRIMSQKGKS